MRFEKPQEMAARPPLDLMVTKAPSRHVPIEKEVDGDTLDEDS